MAETININILKSDDEIRLTVLTNVCRMLVRRGYLDENKYVVSDKTKDKYKYTLDDKIDNELFLKFFDKKRDDNTYTIILDEKYEDHRNTDKKDFDGTKILVKIIHQKINDVNSSPMLNDFIKNDAKYHKIIIVDDFTEKAFIGLSKKANLEIFKESELMIDLMSMHGQPLKVSIINEERIKYLMNPKLPKIYQNDPIARYYNAKKEDFIEAILPNKANPIIEYRRVIDSKLKMFSYE